MIIRIEKAFEKDSNKILDKNMLHKIADCIEEIQKCDSILSIKNIKKLKGANNFYRIRIGDFRIDLFIKDDIVDFVRCLHRKDIYKFFP